MTVWMSGVCPSSSPCQDSALIPATSHNPPGTPHPRAFATASASQPWLPHLSNWSLAPRTDRRARWLDTQRQRTESTATPLLRGQHPEGGGGGDPLGGGGQVREGSAGSLWRAMRAHGCPRPRLQIGIGTQEHGACGHCLNSPEPSTQEGKGDAQTSGATRRMAATKRIYFFF